MDPQRKLMAFFFLSSCIVRDALITVPWKAAAEKLLSAPSFSLTGGDKLVFSVSTLLKTTRARENDFK